jgi:ribonuclease HI
MYDAVVIMKVYVVFVGRTPGVYTTWMDCQTQVSGYPNNLHASFPSRQEGEQTLAQYQASLRNKLLNRSTWVKKTLPKFRTRKW